MFWCWLVLVSLVSDKAVNAAECLVACALLSEDPFDSDGLNPWDDRGACDFFSTGCEVATPSDTYQYCYGSTESVNTHACLWAAGVGTDGSSDCACNVCISSYIVSVDYMEEYPLWTRVQCAIAVMEDAGYDMSVCVAAVVDAKSLLCVDDLYETSTVEQFSCDRPLTSSPSDPSDPACVSGVSERLASKMFVADAVAVSPTPAPTTPVTRAPETGTTAPASESQHSDSSTSVSVETDAPLGSGGSGPGDNGEASSGVDSSSLETVAPLGSEGADPSGEGEDNSDTSASIAIGIASVVVAFLGVVAGVLWGTASTVYYTCDCCNASSGPKVKIGRQAPGKWLPFRMASVTTFEPPKANMTEDPAGGSLALVPHIASRLETLEWEPVPVGRDVFVTVSVDGHSYVFKSCAFTVDGGRRFELGSVHTARGTEGVHALVLDVVTVNDLSELATQYPSKGNFRVLRRCTSHVSSPVTYAVVSVLDGSVLVVR